MPRMIFFECIGEVGERNPIVFTASAASNAASLTRFFEVGTDHARRRRRQEQTDRHRRARGTERVWTSRICWRPT